MDCLLLSASLGISVQCNVVQCSVTQRTTLQFIAVMCNAVQHGLKQCSEARIARLYDSQYWSRLHDRSPNLPCSPLEWARLEHDCSQQVREEHALADGAEADTDFKVTYYGQCLCLTQGRVAIYQGSEQAPGSVFHPHDKIEKNDEI